METFEQLKAMLQNPSVAGTDEQRNEVKELLQKLILYALSQTDFFEHAAFLGGTALRLFYSVRRFSEDLDFSLMNPDPSFSFEKYIPVIEEICKSFGISASVTPKRVRTSVHSAFLKTNTKELIIELFGPSSHQKDVHPCELLKIKIEVDTNPPLGAEWESRYLLEPVPHQIIAYKASSLFAGKIHAVLCRPWSDYPKGRDLYDFVCYVQKKTPVNLEFLKNALIQTNAWDPELELDITDVKDLLREKFQTIDYEAAKKDVIPFLKESPAVLDLWGPDFFIQISESLMAEESDK